MKKIIYLISSLKKNGPNRVLFSMLEGINYSEYEVYIVSFLNYNDENYISKLNKNIKKIYCLNLNRKYQILTKGKKELCKIIDYIKPDIIHSHGTLPDIVNSKTKSSAKKITTIHDNMFEDYIYRFGRTKGRMIIKWHLHHLKKTDECVCCSSSSYEILKKYLNNTTYIRNAIYKKSINDSYYKKERKRIRSKYKIKDTDIVYIYAGNLSKLKKVDLLVEFFNLSLRDNEYLFILGDGELKQNVLAKIANNNIIFVGFTDEVKQYMCASDIYVSFSCSEGFSISVLEALETKNLLLLSNIPSHNEIFSISSDFYLGENFNENDFETKKELIIKNVDNNTKNQIEKFIKNYITITKMMEKYMFLYEQKSKGVSYE